MAESLCASVAVAESRWRGSARRLPGGDFELEEARLWGAGAWQPFAGRVRLGREPAGEGPAFGRELEVVGRAHCRHPRRNPGVIEDGLLTFQPPEVFLHRGRARVLAEPASLTSRVPGLVEKILLEAFPRAIGWRAVERAVWLGDLSGLPPELVDFYREGGLLHVLSLGGQRVQSLVLVGLTALRLVLLLALPLGAWRYLGSLFPFLSAVLPVASCTVLWLASGGAAPLRRVLAMLGAQVVLRGRRIHARSLQIACSSVALLVVWDPSLVGKPAFLLSLGGTIAVCWIAAGGSWRSALKAYAIVALLMPVLLLPWTAFCFSRVAWLAPLHVIAFGWIWYWLIAPLALFLPLMIFCLPLSLRVGIGCGVERGWGALVALNGAWAERVAAGAHSVIRPTVLETLLVMALLLIALEMMRHPLPFAN